MLKNRLKPALAAVALAVVFSPAASATDKKRQEADALLKRGRELTAIRCEGCPPFQYRVRLTLHRMRGGVLATGLYEETWISPKKWRQTITVGDSFRQTRVRLDDRIWDDTTTLYDPFSISLVRSALWVGSYGKYDSGTQSKIARVKYKTYHGTPVAVIVFEETAGKTKVTLYADRQDGKLLRRDEKNDEQGTVETRETSTFRAFCEKVYPFRMTLKLGKWLLVETDAESLVTLAEIPEILPPERGISWSVCERLPTLKHLHTPNPPFPGKLLSGQAQGRVLLYAVIGLDGRLYNSAAVEGSAPELAKYAGDFVSKEWQFEPISCGNEPAPAMVFIWVTFTRF